MLSPLTRLRALILLTAVMSLGFTVPAAAQEADPVVSQEEASQVARTVVSYCQVLMGRMDGLIREDWAAQDIAALSSAWASLGCPHLYGLIPVPSAGAAASEGPRAPRWILR